MNRKLLILRVSFVLSLVATLGVWCWEVQREFATPTQDDIFGHTGAVFIMGIILLAVLLEQWEFYRSLKFFLTDTERTNAKNVSNAIAVGFSGLALVISVVTYLFIPNPKAICVYYIWWTAGVLICNRLATGIYIERNTPWDDSGWINFIRIVKNVLRYVILIPLVFGCLIELFQLSWWLGI